MTSLTAQALLPSIAALIILDSPMLIEDITRLIAKEFSEVDNVIHAQLSSRVPLVEKIAEYIINSGGKRIRPMLVLLSAKLLNQCTEKTIKLATIIEFLHTATLLHDDVVDTSDLRRGKATANAQWGNAPSVLVGDFLYSRAFEMMVELESLDVMGVLSNATCVIAEGEVLQLTNVKNPNISEQQYMQTIQGKTAMLFEASSHSSAILSNASIQEAQALKEYGLQLGMAFQLVDDILDYAGDATNLGKNIGDDLAEGKPTLPLIHAMQHSSETQSQIIRDVIRQGGTDNIAPILTIIENTGSLAYCKDKAHECSEKAHKSLELFADSPTKEALKSLVDIAIARNS